VLIVSADDRVMREQLEDSDYVGMVAVLTQRYAARHGYDYLQLAATSTVGLVDRVRQKYGGQLTSRGVGDNKRGPSAFHPGYGQFRASSWAKVPSVWQALTLFGDRYDYVWFLDSDATLNPRLANRSLSDALKVREPLYCNHCAALRYAMLRCAVLCCATLCCDMLQCTGLCTILYPTVLLAWPGLDVLL
jgi:hypothetical protein